MVVHLTNVVELGLFFRFKGVVPEYIINLDLPPSERWLEVATDKKRAVWNLAEIFPFSYTLGAAGGGSILRQAKVLQAFFIYRLGILNLGRHL